jgi:basic membrane protein A
MRKYLALRLIAAAITLASCSCNGTKSSQSENGGIAAGELKVAMVLPGSIADKSFNQAGYEGLKLIESELKLPITYIEQVQKADQVENLQAFARSGSNVVIGHGGEFQPAVEQAAAKYPNTLFLVNNGTKAGGNIGIISFKYSQIGYLMGYLAAKMSKTGTIGFIGAEQIKTFLAISEGFEKGAKAANPNCKVLVAWTGDWDDVSKAKTTALLQIAGGADVIFPTMDNGTIGSLQAAKEKNVKAIGIYYDAALDPQWSGTVIQSAIINIRTAMLETLKSIKSESKREGKQYIFGVDNPRVLGIGTYHESVPGPVREQIQKQIEAMNTGQLIP